jgi:hypothetical protein
VVGDEIEKGDRVVAACRPGSGAGSAFARLVGVLRSVDVAFFALVVAVTLGVDFEAAAVAPAAPFCVFVVLTALAALTALPLLATPAGFVFSLAAGRREVATLPVEEVVAGAGAADGPRRRPGDLVGASGPVGSSASSAANSRFDRAVTERLRGPRTGVRGVNTHPTPGTGFPPIRRSGSKSHGRSAWNS